MKLLLPRDADERLLSESKHRLDRTTPALPPQASQMFSLNPLLCCFFLRCGFIFLPFAVGLLSAECCPRVTLGVIRFGVAFRMDESQNRPIGELELKYLLWACGISTLFLIAIVLNLHLNYKSCCVVLWCSLFALCQIKMIKLVSDVKSYD